MTAEMLDEADPTAPAPARVRRTPSRRRLITLALILAALSGLWLTWDHWWPLVASTDPYETTPAATFPVGAAGFVPPEAHAVDGLSAEQVAGALGRVKQAMVAAYLDPRLLVQRDPTPVLNLLAPDSADTVRGRFDAGQYGTALVQLAPDATLASTPRVSGQMSYQRVDWDGLPALDVTTNYVVVYAFAKPSGVVVIHAETHWMFPLGGNLRPSSRGMYLGRTSGYWHGMDCTRAALGLTAPAPAVDRNANPNFRDSDPLDAYFDPTRPVDVTSGCR
jgi:hypothetical protein